MLSMYLYILIHYFKQNFTMFKFKIYMYMLIDLFTGAVKTTAKPVVKSTVVTTEHPAITQKPIVVSTSGPGYTTYTEKANKTGLEMPKSKTEEQAGIVAFVAIGVVAFLIVVFMGVSVAAFENKFPPNLYFSFSLCKFYIFEGDEEQINCFKIH